jgi:hypothetical protein
MSNEANGSDVVETSIYINYKFARVNGTYGTMFGNVDFAKLFTTLAIENKTPAAKKKFKLKDALKAGFEVAKYAFTEAGALILDDIKNKRLDDLKNRGTRALKRVAPKGTFVGNALTNFTDPKYLAGMVTNTIDAGLDYVEDKYINRNLTKLNNLMSMNFADNLFEVYKNFSAKPFDATSSFNNGSNNMYADVENKGTSMIEKQDIQSNMQPRHYTPEAIRDVNPGVTYSEENIYKRNSF